jgi:signal transduction histidine kinase
MKPSALLAKWLPTDPGYAPFGWRWLRGFNLLPLALVVFVGSVSGLQNIALSLITGRNPAIDWARLGDTLAHQPLRLLMLACLLTPLVALIVAALNLDAGRRWRVVALSVAVIAGSGLYGLLLQPGLCMAGAPDAQPKLCDPFLWAPWARFSAAAGGGLWGALIALILFLDRAERDAARHLHATRLRRLAAERDEDEARLRSLQAQIEPHFLFNTLAHLQRLQEVDPPRGHAMLDSLIRYMRSALPRMREATSTLRHELALTQAYAQLQQIRMGERLRFEVDVPDALLDVQLPPMMVLTLAENAVKHGLSPKREGGTLRIAARCVGQQLEVEVCDDGVGLKLGAGGGRGLANTRSRLAAQFGSRGVLDIANRLGGGVRAALLLPLLPQPGLAA